MNEVLREFHQIRAFASFDVRVHEMMRKIIVK